MARPRFQKLEPEKQERILMAAAVEFAQKGFEGASFNQIIEAADISKGAAYYYFDDKSDLYTTVIEHAFERLAAFFGDFSMDRLDRDNFWDLLEDYSRKSLRRAQEHPKLTQLLRTVFNYVRAHPGAPGGQIVDSATRSWTSRFLRRGQELGVVRDDVPEELLIELLMGIGYAIDSWVLEHVDAMSEEEMDRYATWLTEIHRKVCEPPGGPA